MHFRQIFSVTVNFRSRKTRLNYLRRDVPADPDNEQRRRGREKVIVERVELYGRIQNSGASLRQTLQQWVYGRRYEACRKSTGDTGKSGGDTGERVAAGSVKNYAAQRNNQDIPGIGRRVACDTNHDNHRRQKPVAGDVQQCPQTRVDKAGCLSNTDTEHCNQHHANRVKVREVRHHHRHEFCQCGTGQEVLDNQCFARARIDKLKRYVGQHPRKNPNDKQ